MHASYSVHVCIYIEREIQYLNTMLSKHALKR